MKTILLVFIVFGFSGLMSNDASAMSKKKWTQQAYFQNFSMAGMRLQHTFNCLKGNNDCVSVNTLSTAHAISSPKDPRYAVKIAGASNGMSDHELCIAEFVANQPLYSPCFFAYGVQGVCHTYTERVLSIAETSLGVGFNKIPGGSGYLSYFMYGRFGIPLPFYSFTACRAASEARCMFSF